MSKEPSPVEWPTPGRPPDDPDGLLRAFFRTEVPDPWPRFRRPEGPATAPGPNGAAAEPARSTRAGRVLKRLGPALRSRLALASAAALLLVATLLLSGRFQSNRPPDDPTGPGFASPDMPKKLVLPRDVIIKESLIQEGEQPTKYMINIYAP